MSFQSEDSELGIVVGPDGAVSEASGTGEAWSEISERTHIAAFDLLDNASNASAAFNALIVSLRARLSAVGACIWIMDSEIGAAYPIAVDIDDREELRLAKVLELHCRNSFKEASTIQTVAITGTDLQVQTMPLVFHNKAVGVLAILARVVSSTGNSEKAVELAKRLCLAMAYGQNANEAARQGAELVSTNHRLETVLRDGQLRERKLETTLVELRNTRSSLEERTLELATIGQLASGIAHEINNPATYVLLNLEQIKTLIDELITTPDRSSLSEFSSLIDESLEGVGRIAGICRELLPLSRVEPMARKSVYLHEVALSACRMVNNKVRHRARLVFRLAPVDPVEGDANRLIQVVTNLVVNAAQAIPTGDSEKNVVTIETKMSEDHALLRVTDTGSGISPEIMNRIFEPFFTTKSREQGTGLGLHICQTIVHEHRGSLTVSSQVGRGSTFQISLPVTEFKVADASMEPAQSTRRRVKVLIVDDEPLIVRGFARALGRYHYVRSFVNSREALLCLQEEEFDVIVSDLMMPGLSGPDLYKAIAVTHPHLAERFVFCSGGAFTAEVREFLTIFNPPILQKPIRMKDLIAYIRARVENS